MIVGSRSPVLDGLWSGSLIGVGLWWGIGHPFWLSVGTCAVIATIWGVIVKVSRGTNP